MPTTADVDKPPPTPQITDDGKIVGLWEEEIVLLQIVFEYPEPQNKNFSNM